jgi:carbohydrate kinase (thermoresistant glucokinase family)
MPLAVVVMGVSGCGKSTVGQALAPHLRATFLDADDFHPPANVERMRAGIALTDAEREPWLAALAARLAQAQTADEPIVLACSALKRSYRDALRRGAPALHLVHLTGSTSLLAKRIGARADHYMPPTLLPSQLATLETPGADERPITLDVALPTDRLVAALLERLK